MSNAGDKFGVLDKDHDGMVSKAEARKDKELSKEFDKLDANKDGKLDQGEFAQFEAGSSSNQKSTTSGKQ
jgi:Ca2+-binding EF-hand superfamily protein